MFSIDAKLNYLNNINILIQMTFVYYNFLLSFTIDKKGIIGKLLYYSH